MTARRAIDEGKAPCAEYLAIRLQRSASGGGIRSGLSAQKGSVQGAIRIEPCKSIPHHSIHRAKASLDEDLAVALEGKTVATVIRPGWLVGE